MNSSIRGELFGAYLTPRAPNDPHLMIQLITEDDECWHHMGDSFSSYWIDDLIKTLTKTKEELANYPKDPSGYGHTL
jgi:hypothetical protein